jgi:hypothetical protein
MKLAAKPSRCLIWGVVVVLFLALALVAGYKVWPLLNPRISARAPLDPDCDLRAGPCTARFAEGGTVALRITPAQIPLVQPLQLEVTLRDMQARRVEVDFQGVDMNMGYNRPSLKQASAGRFIGQGMLPVCVRYAMEWEARVLLHTESGLLAAPFRFITVTPGAEGLLK